MLFRGMERQVVIRPVASRQGELRRAEAFLGSSRKNSFCCSFLQTNNSKNHGLGEHAMSRRGAAEHVELRLNLEPAEEFFSRLFFCYQLT